MQTKIRYIIYYPQGSFEFHADENFPTEVDYALTHGCLLKICTYYGDVWFNPSNIIYIKRFKD